MEKPIKRPENQNVGFKYPWSTEQYLEKAKKLDVKIQIPKPKKSCK